MRDSRSTVFGPLPCWLAILASLVAAGVMPSHCAGAESARSGDWQTLFQGKSLDGWKGKSRLDVGEWMLARSVSLDSVNRNTFAIQSGTGIFVNGASGRTIDLFTVPQHGDVEAHVEFVVPEKSNSGVYFQGRYEIQVLDSWGVKQLKHGDCGGIYQRWKDGKGFEGHAPRVNASKRPGEWQSFDVIFRAPRFDENGRKTENARFVKVIHNGITVHENVEVTGPTRAAAFSDEGPKGPLMLQGDHGPVAYRNLKIRPIQID
jgi:hypothetical protein